MQAGSATSCNFTLSLCQIFQVFVIAMQNFKPNLLLPFYPGNRETLASNVSGYLIAFHDSYPVSCLFSQLYFQFNMQVGALREQLRAVRWVAESLCTDYLGLAAAALHDTGSCFSTAFLRLIDRVCHAKTVYDRAQVQQKPSECLLSSKPEPGSRTSQDSSSMQSFGCAATFSNRARSTILNETDSLSQTYFQVGKLSSTSISISVV